MQVKKKKKIVVNVGCGDARDNAKSLEAVVRDIGVVTGQKAVIVNEAFANLFNLGRDVVGKHVAAPYNSNLDYQIIGLMKNARLIHPLAVEPMPFLLIPYTQSGVYGVSSLVFHVKTALPENSVIPQIRSLVSRMDPSLPIENLTTMSRTVRENTFSFRFSFTLAVAGACLAVLLTAVGLYGIFAYNVALRRREIGMRMAFGATRGRMYLMFLRHAALIALIGCAIGFGLSIYAGKLIESQLYQFEGFDKGVFIGAAALLLVIMILAALIPVRRAVTSEPLELLHDE
jgi:ABC-type antimicrobial peptide transport system permease subunit